MTMTTASDLLDWLGRNLFLPAAQVDQLRASLSNWPDAHALAKELIRRNWLSPYQVNQVLQGKGEALLVGSNRLLERIGEGSMGQVFKAWNTRLGRIVAVKMIHREHIANAKAMERFRREVQAAALVHPNIVLVLDADEAEGRPFMVMEFVVGENLSQRVKLQGPLPVGEAVDYVRQAALGLQHAFERGVVHRDIKPGNLLLTMSADEKPLVKIMDFGLARFDSEMHNVGRLTHAGNILGTVDYIAPEQAQDARTADIRADIYGLGCTLFYLLTGKPPFPGSTTVEKLLARQGGEPPSVRAERPEAPAGLDAVLRRMLARRPEERYQTPLEVAQGLAPFTRLTQAEVQTLNLSPADLAAALTARELAQALPVTQPVSSGVPLVQAWPVAQPLAAPALALAQPITLTSASLPEERPSFPWTGAADPFAGDPAPAEPAVASIAGPAPRSRQHVLLWTGGAAAALALVIGLAVALFPGPHTLPPAKVGYFNPGAALKIMPLEPRTFKEGDSKFIIVKVVRSEFVGPVHLHFEGLPADGMIGAGEVTMTEKQDTSQIRLTVRFGAGAMKRDLRLVAVAENLRDETILPLTIVTNRNVPADD